MSELTKKLEDELMNLPACSRARLAELLIASLDQEPADTDAERIWAAEAERRAMELGAGEVEEVPAEQAFARARAQLR